MSGIDPSVIVHEINTIGEINYPGKTIPNTSPQDHFHQSSDQKTFEKWFHLSLVIKLNGFLILSSYWKKQGTIIFCINYRDLNKACPKDSYPTPLSTKSLIIVLEVSFSLLFTTSVAIIRSKSSHPINTRQLWSAHGEPFLITSYPLVFKMLGPLFNGL